MVAFVGLDLAWTPHNESGICVVEGVGRDARLVSIAAEVHPPEWFASLCEQAGPNVVAAIDAPLVVKAGRRAERELAVVFGKAKASAYTATLDFLLGMNGMAGPMLAALLSGRGFHIVPSAIAASGPGRFAIEVFPHPAHVELFSLSERLRYKKGRVGARRMALAEYQAHLRSLLSRELPLVAEDPRVDDLLSAGAIAVGGKALKRVEDQLDALTCAYVAHHCWVFGQEGFRVFGEEATGTIVVPLRMVDPQGSPTSSLALSSP